MIRPLMKGDPDMMPPVVWLRRMPAHGPQVIGGAVRAKITMATIKSARPAAFSPACCASVRPVFGSTGTPPV